VKVSRLRWKPSLSQPSPCVASAVYLLQRFASPRTLSKFTGPICFNLPSPWYSWHP
jgi:hypothetical protein